ncbi:MAG: NifU N-terminal domain-containing protein [Acidimicrobiia bacterium]
MACATPSPTPNPNAMKFTLDVTLPDRILADRGDDVDDELTRALLAIEGVASVFGINDFVTITREEGVEWEPIIAATQQVVAEHLDVGGARPDADAVARARQLLRNAVAPPKPTPVDLGRQPEPDRE